MPICGFNKKMRKGLEMFNEGLVEHGLIDRTQKNNESIDQGIKRELSDMTRLFLEINRIENAPKRILTEGLIRYAMGFYLLMRTKNVEQYKQVVASINQYFFDMDDIYYSKLEGKLDDMRELAEFLNRQKI
ncbi:MAG TPA: hypothetical protein VG621_01960 [Candidatus Paceibacterota bacterium]|nr:hypothetical protein [Candidatus Paceibacterota bacterium]